MFVLKTAHKPLENVPNCKKKTGAGYSGQSSGFSEGCRHFTETKS